MELQLVIWQWHDLALRLREAGLDQGYLLDRSTRPVAAERLTDGKLKLVLGCWWEPDLKRLRDPVHRSQMDKAMGKMLEDSVVSLGVPWPGGMVSDEHAGEGSEPIPAPDVMAGLPDEARMDASQCESSIHRLFYARAYLKGLQLECQHPFLNYRIDFVVPGRKIGAEVQGWDWHQRVRRPGDWGERRHQLESEDYRLLWFSGSQVLANPDACVDQLIALAGGGRIERRGPTQNAPNRVGSRRPPNQRRP